MNRGYVRPGCCLLNVLVSGLFCTHVSSQHLSHSSTKPGLELAANSGKTTSQRQMAGTADLINGGFVNQSWKRTFANREVRSFTVPEKAPTRAFSL